MPDYVTPTGNGVLFGTARLPTVMPPPNQIAQPQVAIPVTGAPQNNFDSILGNVIANRQMHARAKSDLGGLMVQRDRLAASLAGVAPGRRGESMRRSLQAQIGGIDSRMRNVASAAHAGDIELSTAMKYAEFQNRVAQQNLKQSDTLMQHQHDANIATALANRTARIANGNLQIGSPEDAQLLSDLALNNNYASRGSLQRLQSEVVKHDSEKLKRDNVLGGQIQNALGVTPDQFAGILQNPNATRAGLLKPDESGRAGFDKAGHIFGKFSQDATEFLPEKYQKTEWEKIPEDVRAEAQNKFNQNAKAVQIDTGNGLYTVPRQQFENWQRRFAPARQAAAAAAQPTADEYAQAQGFRDAAQLQRFRETGKLEQTTEAPSSPTAVAPVPAAQPPAVRKYNPKTGQLE